MHPLTGLPVLALVLYFGIYKFVGVFGGGVAVDFLEHTLFGKWINPWLTHLVEHLLPNPLWRNLFVGDYGVFTLGLTYAVAIVLPVVGPVLFRLRHPGGQRVSAAAGHAHRPAVQMHRAERARGDPAGTRLRLRYHGHHGHARAGDETRAHHHHAAARAGRALRGAERAVPGHARSGAAVRAADLPVYPVSHLPGGGGAGGNCCPGSARISTSSCRRCACRGWATCW